MVKRAVVVLLLVLSVSATSRADDPPSLTPWLRGIALARAADATTTALALRGGGRELHPLLPQTIGANLTVQAAVTTGEVWALAALAKRRPALARVVSIALYGVEVAAVAHNIRTLRVH